MVRLTVHRTGNSLAVPLPRELVRRLGMRAGDVLEVELQPLPDLLRLAGSLKGRLTADEFTRLSNEGEELG